MVPGAESNHRHEDFQSGANSSKPNTYKTGARQTPDETSKTYLESVKPAEAELTNENPGTTAIATGVKDVMEGVCSYGKDIAALPILAMHWGVLL